MTMRKLGTVAAAVAGCVALAGCGGGSSSGSAGPAATSGSVANDASACVATVTKSVQAAQSIPSLPAPSAVPASRLTGKLVVAVPDTLAIPSAAVWVSGVKAAAKAVGANLRIIDGQGTPSGQTAALQQAANLRPAVVVMYGIVTSNVSGGVSTLASAHIPLVASYPGIPTTAKYAIDSNWRGIGVLEADYALEQTKCDLDAVLFTSSVYTNITVQVNAAVAEIKKQCPTCKSRVINEDVSKLATSVQPDTVAALQRDPKANFVIAAYGGLASFILAGLDQAGSSSVHVITNTGTSQNVDYVRQGKAQTADIEAVPAEEQGWISMDDAVRAVGSDAPLTQWNPLPVLLITSSNVSQATSYLASTAYETQFKTAWQGQ